MVLSGKDNISVKIGLGMNCDKSWCRNNNPLSKSTCAKCSNEFTKIQLNIKLNTIKKNGITGYV